MTAIEKRRCACGTILSRFNDDDECAACVDANTRSLDDLAVLIVREDELTREHAGKMLEHAILCGEALLEAQSQVPWGDWGTWLAVNFPKGETRSRDYMRIARFKDQIGDQVDTIHGAMRVLKGKTDGEFKRAFTKPRSDSRPVVQELKAEGLTHAEIAAKLGLPVGRVQALYREPEEQQAQKNAQKTRMRSEAAATRRRRRDEDMEHLGGQACATYTLLRSTMSSLELLHADSEEPICGAIQGVINRLAASEDMFFRAVTEA